MNKTQQQRIASVEAYLRHLEGCAPHAETDEIPGVVQANFDRIWEILSSLKQGAITSADAVLEAYWHIEGCQERSLVRIGWAELERLAQEL